MSPRNRILPEKNIIEHICQDHLKWRPLIKKRDSPLQINNAFILGRYPYKIQNKNSSEGQNNWHDRKPETFLAIRVFFTKDRLNTEQNRNKRYLSRNDYQPPIMCIHHKSRCHNIKHPVPLHIPPERAIKKQE